MNGPIFTDVHALGDDTLERHRCEQDALGFNFCWKGTVHVTAFKKGGGENAAGELGEAT